MHSARPYGLLVARGEIDAEDRAFIHHEILKFSNNKKLSNLDSSRHVKDLPNGGYVVFQDMGGMLKAIAHKPVQEKYKLDGFAKIFVPMLFSGVITKSIVLQDEGRVGLKITEQTKRRLNNYSEGSVSQTDLELDRFRVDYEQGIFDYFKPKQPGIYFHSQYTKLKPTWYSGAMTEVVQIISGYGKFKGKATENLSPDAVDIETIEFTLPDDYLEKIAEEIYKVRLPAYSGIPYDDGQIRYEYGFSKCHIVSFDDENNPWLLQIDSRAVWATPLPIVPVTTTDTFRQYIEEEVQDEEILRILDRFGGLPSGETFYNGNDFETWRRAGVYIEVCKTNEFYKYMAIYAACGWSFNSNGTEGFNTCYEYNNNGLMQVHGYKLSIKLKSTHKNGWLDSVTISGERASVIANYVNKLSDLLRDGEQKSLAILYKLRRVPEEDIYQLALTALNSPLGVTSSDIDYWDNYEAASIANHSGSLARTTSGSVYMESKNPLSMGGLKFPEMSGQGCESFDMTSQNYEGGFVRSDTVIFGYYVEDQLKVVKYFNDSRTFKKEEQSNFEDVMILGTWDKTTILQNTGIHGHFYTSDFDDRQEISPTTIYTVVKGSNMGYGNPAFQTPPLLVKHGGLSRARYYKHETTTTTINGFNINIGVCIPVFNRDCVLYAYTQGSSSKTVHEKHTQHGVMDPTSYPLWTYDPIYHWMGGAGKGEPKPTIGEYVYVYGPPYYEPNEYSDFADSGDWYGVGASYKSVTAICGPYTDRNSGHFHANGVIIGGEAPYMPPYEHTETTVNDAKGNLNISYKGTNAISVHKNIPDAWYFSFSPVDSGGTPFYFYRDACRIAFGDSTYANMSETDQYKRRYKWGDTRLVDHTTVYSFIGVINE